jgi:hypothetical protein
MSKKGKKATITWQIDLAQLIDRRVTVETREGHNRNGVLTEIRYDATSIIGHTVEYPTAIVLDGDDLIPFAQIVSLKLAD